MLGAHPSRNLFFSSLLELQYTELETRGGRASAVALHYEVRSSRLRSHGCRIGNNGVIILIIQGYGSQIKRYDPVSANRCEPTEESYALRIRAAGFARPFALRAGGQSWLPVVAITCLRCRETAFLSLSLRLGTPAFLSSYKQSCQDALHQPLRCGEVGRGNSNDHVLAAAAEDLFPCGTRDGAGSPINSHIA
jgi:hypothetical protein